MGQPAASDSEGDGSGNTDGTLGDSSKRGELNTTGSSLKRSELGMTLRKEMRLEKAQRDKAAAKRAMFNGRSAEAVLHSRSRTGDAVVLRRPPKEPVMESLDITDTTLQPSPSKSSSLPSLRYFEREPAEYAEQHYAEAARQARSYLRGMYRDVPKQMPPQQELILDDGKFHTASPPRTVYGPQPFVLPPANLDMIFLKSEPVEKDANPPRRRTALKQLRSFGASCHGAPYTLSQVYEEISAKLDHKKPRDVRPMQGKLGALEIGAGATPSRRNLPFVCNGRLGLLSSSDSDGCNAQVPAIKDAEPENGE